MEKRFPIVSSMLLTAALAACEPSPTVDETTRPPSPAAYTAVGTASAANTDTNWKAIPDMELALSLADESAVLVELDLNVVGDGANAWAAVRLVVDGQADAAELHVNPSAAGEDDHVHLFRIVPLGAGDHAIRAEWGLGGGTVVRNPVQDHAIWGRKLSAVAVPLAMGVKIGQVDGTTDECQAPLAQGTFATVPEMALDLTLAEESVILTEYEMVLVGASSAHKSVRLVVDGDPDDANTTVQPIGSADEDDALHLFRIDTLPAGTHTLVAEWGQGGGAQMCSNASAGNVSARRLGYLAIPTSTGAMGFYATGTTDASHAASGAVYSTIPQLQLNPFLDRANWYVALTQLDLNFEPATDAAWVAARISVDNLTDFNWTHAQPSNAFEDDAISQHRVDLLGPGSHYVRGEWGDGGGTANNPIASSASKYWSRRLGMLVVPVP